QVVVANTYRPVLEWLVNRWQGVIVRVCSATERQQASFAWRLSGYRCEPFLSDVRPFLQIKGDVVDNALALLAYRRDNCIPGHPTPEAVIQAQHTFYLRHRPLMHEKRSQPTPPPQSAMIRTMAS